MVRRCIVFLLLAGCADDTVRGTKAPPAGSEEVADSQDSGDPSTDTGVPAADIVPLYSEEPVLERAIVFSEDGALITDIGDRARDRHAREDQFQSYDHWLPHYFEYRTARLRFVDHVASAEPGSGTIDISIVTEWKLSVMELRAWYSGRGTVAAYYGNYAAGFEETGPGIFDEDHVQVDDTGRQYRYTFSLDHAYTLEGGVEPLAVGQHMEVEVSQFLAGPPSGRANYYGTTLLYAVGTGGMVPWGPVGDFADGSSEREDSRPLETSVRLGGDTTLHEMTSAEPDNSFMQMATNLAGRNAQPFVRGRRVLHTDMTDGSHDEHADNPVFDDLVGLAGPRFASPSCDSCHHRNGRAPVPEVGEPLDHYVVKVADASGAPLAAVGGVLQSNAVEGEHEGDAWIEAWTESEGLRAPVYGWSLDTPAQYSIRIAPPLVGIGLIEAIPEDWVLSLEDPWDDDGDGISGRARRVVDPTTGDIRLGRFGWRAGTAHVAHQTAAALAADMGVLTSLVPDPDCGSAQTDCEEPGAELSDDHLDDLVRYVSLLGVRPQRDAEDPEVVAGARVFEDLGCADCHAPEVQTSGFHPLAELRNQTIRPYTDLLLHDMGPGLADTLDEGSATAREWRTAPLWGIGLGDCVTGGVQGEHGSETCLPHASYLHDGRARTLTEAILWHGGESEASKDAFVGLDDADQSAVLRFLGSL